MFQIQTNFDIRERIGKSHSFEEFRDCVLLLKERSDTNWVMPSLITSFFRFLKYHTGEETFETPEEIQIFNLKVTFIMYNEYPILPCSLKSSLQLPPWLCQPYVRPPPDVYLEKMRSVSFSNPQLMILLGFSSFLFSLMEIDFIL